MALRFDQPRANRVPHQPGRLVDVQLFHDAGAVEFGRLDADLQDARDLLRALPLHQQLQHLQLAVRERLPRSGRGPQGLDHGGGDAGTDVHAATTHFADRLKEIVRRVRLYDEPPRATPARVP